jgi:hypothetical protein
MGNYRGLALVCAALLACAPAHADDKLAADLKSYGITIERDAQGKVSKVALPAGARDYHLELILDNPEIAASVTELHAPRCKASFERFKELAKLPALTALNLDGVEQANDYVACLAGMKQLTRLSLASSMLSNHGLHDLCAMHPQLLELDISRTKVDTAGMESLGKLARLETIRALNVTPVHFILDATQEEIENAKLGFRHIAQLPSIRRIVIDDLTITEEDVSALACNCHLEELHTGDGYSSPFRVDTAALIYLQECCPRVVLGAAIAKSMQIDVKSHDGWLIEIRQCTQSQLLRIPKSQLVRLAQLSLHGARDLEFLNWLPKIERLRLVQPEFDVNQFNALRHTPTVTSLSLSDLKIDDKLADVLVAISTLKELELHGCQIENRAIHRLENATEGLKIRIIR